MATFWSVFQAVEQGSFFDVQKCILAKADVNRKDKASGFSPLILAVCENKVDVVKLLLDSGAKVESSDRQGRTALHYASDYGLVECVHALVNAGAGLNVKDEEGYTALHVAAERGNVGVVKMLVNAGARIDSVTKRLRIKAVALASDAGHDEVVQVLEKAHVAKENLQTAERFSRLIEKGLLGSREALKLYQFAEGKPFGVSEETVAQLVAQIPYSKAEAEKFVAEKEAFLQQMRAEKRAAFERKNQELNLKNASICVATQRQNCVASQTTFDRERG